MSRPLLSVFIFINIATVILLAILFIYPHLQKKQDINKNVGKAPTEQLSIEEEVIEKQLDESMSGYKQMNVSTDIKNTKAALTDYNFLMDQLDAMNFWEIKGVVKYSNPGASMGKYTAHNLDIKLTNTPQSRGGFVDDKNQTYQSYGFQYGTNGTITISVNIRPDSRENDAKVLASHYSWITLFALYDLTHELDKNKAVEEQFAGFKEFSSNLDKLASKSFIEVKI